MDGAGCCGGTGGARSQREAQTQDIPVGVTIYRESYARIWLMGGVRMLEHSNFDFNQSQLHWRSQVVDRLTSTEPVDRRRVEELMTMVYRLAGLSMPAFVWFDNPWKLQSAPRSFGLPGRRQFNLGPFTAAMIGAAEVLRRELFGEEEMHRFRQRFRVAVGGDLVQTMRNIENAEVLARHHEQTASVSLQQRVLSAWTLLIDTYEMIALRNYFSLSLNPDERVRLNLFHELAKVMHHYIAFPEACLLCERPLKIICDDPDSFPIAGRCEVYYRDSFVVRAWDGVRMPLYAMQEPTVEMIDEEPNAEIRQVLIRRYGFTRYLRDTTMELIHEDQCGTLYHKRIGDELVAVVHVVNSTPEPDGTYKDYLLRVPPHVKTAREAVTWTFSMSEREYAPLLQT
jgi:hypothetical protein